MRVDRISGLPDEILTKILSDLPTKSSVRTSVLSKRWESLWLGVPTLDLDYHDFVDDDDFIDVEAYTGFISRFLKSNKQLELNTCKLIYNVYQQNNSAFESWIDAAIKRRVRDLTVESDLDESNSLEVVMMPCSLYRCQTLVNLTLHRLHLDAYSKSYSLPCLERMHLEMVKFGDVTTLEDLISSCESLQELTIIRDQNDLLEDIIVSSESLKRFVLYYEAEESLFSIRSVEIDAPKLEFLSLGDRFSERIIISSISPSAQVCVDVAFGVDIEYESLDTDDASKTDMIGEFLTGLSNVRHIIITAVTLKIISDYCSVATLPQFANLHRLRTMFFESSLEFLPILLESCPNLHSLVLDFHQRSVVTKTKPIKFSTVPQCFQSSLEFVQIATDTLSKLELATYFLENCAVLKKLKLCESFYPVLPKIRRIRKKHSECMIDCCSRFNGF